MIDLHQATTAIDVACAATSLVCTVIIYTNMRRIKRSRNVLEQALAETNQLRGIAMQAMAKGPH